MATNTGTRKTLHSDYFTCKKNPMKISDNGLVIIFKVKRRTFNSNCVGKDVFFTKKEAEQKLKELK